MQEGGLLTSSLHCDTSGEKRKPEPARFYETLRAVPALDDLSV
jgi:hypothetical protein